MCNNDTGRDDRHNCWMDASPLMAGGEGGRPALWSLPATVFPGIGSELTFDDFTNSIN